MIQVKLDVPGIAVWHDLRTDTWTVEEGGQHFTLRRWHWGERLRLVRAAVHDAQFDSAHFVRAVADLLTEPPLAELNARITFACLHLLGVPEQRPSTSLVNAEHLLAHAFGWRPSDLGDQPVDSLDALVANLLAARAAQRSDDAGWHSIVMTDAGAPEAAKVEDARIRTRVANMLDSVACWVGATVAPTQSDPAGEPLSAIREEDSAPQSLPEDELPTRGSSALAQVEELQPEKATHSEPPARSLLTPFSGSARLQPIAAASTEKKRAAEPSPQTTADAAHEALDTGWSSSRSVELGLSRPPESPAPFLSQAAGSVRKTPAWGPMIDTLENTYPPDLGTTPSPALLELPLSFGQVEPPGVWNDPLTTAEPWRPGLPAQAAPDASAQQAPSRAIRSALGEPPAALPIHAGYALGAEPADLYDPFALSELEERMADVLAAAAREAGIDLP